MMRLFDCVRRLCPPSKEVDASPLSQALTVCENTMESSLKQLGFLKALQKKQDKIEQDIDLQNYEDKRIAPTVDKYSEEILRSRNIIDSFQGPQAVKNLVNTLVRADLTDKMLKEIKEVRYIHSKCIPEKVLVIKKEGSDQESIINIFLVLDRIKKLKQAIANKQGFTEADFNSKLSFVSEQIRVLKEYLEVSPHSPLSQCFRTCEAALNIKPSQPQQSMNTRRRLG